MLKGKRFQRLVEDFDCEVCGAHVEGSGYTNHCPNCLWSKHVDINPGDRSNGCKGLMEPVDAYFKNGQWHVIHKCKKCEETKTIKMKEGDSMEKIEKIVDGKIRN